MKVTFDSNVWRKIVSPDKFPKEPSISDFRKIRQAIVNATIEPYISETVFTIESIKRADRKSFFGSQELKIETPVTENADGTIRIGFNMGPGESISFAGSPMLKEHFEDAVRLGFRITRFPRVGGLINSEVEQHRYKQSGNDLARYHDKVFEVGRKIQDCEAGFFHIESIGKKYDSFWVKGVKDAPAYEDGNISKAAAEWADGDSIAICIGIGCDFFCSRDEAKSAGQKSVFSVGNLNWLKSDYGLNVISPERLAQML